VTGLRAPGRSDLSCAEQTLVRASLLRQNRLMMVIVVGTLGCLFPVDRLTRSMRSSRILPSLEYNRELIRR
jgi:hypothetical protein